MIHFLFLPFETVLPHKDDQKFMYGVFFLLSFLMICLYYEHKYTHFLCVLLGKFKRALKILEERVYGKMLVYFYQTFYIFKNTVKFIIYFVT